MSIFMDNFSRYLVIYFSLSVFLCGTAVFAEPLAGVSPDEQNIFLQEDNFEHIQFKRIKANNYIYQNQQLKIEVDNSASFLMMPFDHVKKISHVSFQWRSIGKPGVENKKHEEKRSGDDAVFKVALLLKADETLFNPLMPAWMKRVDKLLSVPSKEMIYLVADAKHAADQSWVNPYNDRVKMIAMKNSVDVNGWMKASYTFEHPVEVVGLWLMSDGDNTHSRFTTKVKNIVLKKYPL
jgi:hypothetical protein